MTLLAFGILLTACELAPTPYQPLNDASNDIMGGYTPEQISEQTYRIRFEANENTALERTEEYWHSRATELCQSADYEAEMYSDIDEGFGYVGGALGFCCCWTAGRPTRRDM